MLCDIPLIVSQNMWDVGVGRRMLCDTADRASVR
jgi:hypothetical protein